MITRMGDRNRIADARGRTVTQIDPVLMHVLRWHAVIPAEPLRQIAEELDHKWASRAYAIVLLNVVGLALCWSGMAYYMLMRSARGRLDLVTILICGIQLGLMACGFLVSWRIAKGRRFERTTLVLLKHRRCPHCGYDLRGLNADPDDSAVSCPECGCAWRIDADAITDRTASTTDRVRDPAKRGRSVVLATLVLLTLGLFVLTWIGWRQMRVARGSAGGSPVAFPVANQAPANPTRGITPAATSSPDEEQNTARPETP